MHNNAKVALMIAKLCIITKITREHLHVLTHIGMYYLGLTEVVKPVSDPIGSKDTPDQLTILP